MWNGPESTLSSVIYETIQGFIAACIAILVTDAMTKAPQGMVKDQFEAMEDAMKRG
jgi:SSS family solute:Na+ symporter